MCVPKVFSVSLQTMLLANHYQIHYQLLIISIMYRVKSVCSQVKHVCISALPYIRWISLFTGLVCGVYMFICCIWFFPNFKISPILGTQLKIQQFSSMLENCRTIREQMSCPSNKKMKSHCDIELKVWNRNSFECLWILRRSPKLV